MKSRTVRNRALRAVVGGLLMSSLDEAELKRLARELDFEFLEDLRDILSSLPLGPTFYRDELYRQESSSDLVNAIYELAKGKRLSKDRIFAYMKEIDLASGSSIGSTESTLRGIIESFVARVGRDGAERLVSRLSGKFEQDPYLMGISARK